MMWTLCSSTPTYTVSGKQYTRHLLRESFRENGKVAHHTSPTCLAAPKPRSGPSSSPSSTSTISTNSATSTRTSPSSRVSLRGRGDPLSLNASAWSMSGLDLRRQESPVASVARVLEQGSRLSAVRLANAHAACDILELDVFDEDDLQDNRTGSPSTRSRLKIACFVSATAHRSPTYICTTSPAATWKASATRWAVRLLSRRQGEMQVVYGLLCDFQGSPLRSRNFRGTPPIRRRSDRKCTR